MIALEDALPQHSPHALHHRLGPGADGSNHLDFPTFFALPRELRQVLSFAPKHLPAALLHRRCDAVVQVEWHIADERNHRVRPELAQHSVEERRVRLHLIRSGFENRVVAEVVNQTRRQARRRRFVTLHRIREQQWRAIE